MNDKKAIQILQQMQNWRRHDRDEYMKMPHTPKEFGEAIDYAIRKLKGL